MKDPYLIFNMDKSATDEQLQAEYERLKNLYSEQRFLPGDEGNNAARLLSDLEESWRIISDERDKEKAQKVFGSSYANVDNLIKQSRFDEAQTMLDSMTARPAEWHYLQSIIYYKREWMNECRAQLTMAVNLEPNNEKYKTALDKLGLIMGNPRINPETLGRDPSQAQPNMQEEQVCGNSCANCCMAYCMADCCCSMSRGCC